MPAGLSSQFNILEQSPHDFNGHSAPAPSPRSGGRWVPSRYNVRATTEDGRMVLWNTFHGRMNVFPAKSVGQIRHLLRQKGFDGPLEGMAKYLEERGYLIEEGSDEFRQIELAFGRQHYRTDILELILLASEDCNLRCQYCYEEFARGTMSPDIREGVKNLVRKRLPALRTLSAAWFGGEPLYGFAAIEDLAPFFLRMAQENALTFSSHMTTNAYLLTPDVAEKLLAWKIDNYQITIDGPPEDHDRNRPARNGEGTFSTIYRNLVALKQQRADFTVDIRVNFDHNNHPHLEELFDLLQRDFRDDARFKVRLRAVGKWGGPNDEQLEVCGVDEKRTISQRLVAEARKRGLQISDGLLEIRSFGSQICYAARPYNFVIGASGKLMKCTIDLDMKDRNVVGQLEPNGDLQLDQDKMALWTEAAFQRDTKCQKCVVLPTCQGVHCPQVRMDTGQSPCTPLRQEWKTALLQTVEASEGRARIVRVDSPAAKSSPKSSPKPRPKSGAESHPESSTQGPAVSTPVAAAV